MAAKARPRPVARLAHAPEWRFMLGVITGGIDREKIDATRNISLLSGSTRSRELRTPSGELPGPREDSILLRQSCTSTQGCPRSDAPGCQCSQMRPQRGAAAALHALVQAHHEVLDQADEALERPADARAAVVLALAEGRARGLSGQIIKQKNGFSGFLAFVGIFLRFLGGSGSMDPLTRE